MNNQQARHIRIPCVDPYVCTFHSFRKAQFKVLPTYIPFIIIICEYTLTKIRILFILQQHKQINFVFFQAY